MELTIVALLLAVQAVTAGQQPPRDVMTNRSARGDAQIAGAVVDDTGAPVERAQVLLVGDSAERSHAAITGPDGRYSFVNLPPSAFTLTVSKAGTRPRQFGQPSPGMAGTIIHLAGSQRFTANITLPRGGAIAGVVLDEEGTPLPYARVVAIRSTYAGGRSAFETFARGGADSRGRYRLYGLLLGDVFVAAGEPPSLLVRPPAGAVKVSLAPGDQRLGIDLRRVPPEPPGSVHVTVNVPAGMTARNYHVRLLHRDNPAQRVERYMDAASFDLPDVAASAYELQVDARLSDVDAGPRAIGPLHWASATVAVDVGDRLEVTLALQRAMTVTGRIVFDGTKPPPTDLARVHWSFVQTDPLLARLGNTSVSGRTDDSGAFVMREALPGSYTFGGSMIGGWQLQSIQVDGRDVTDAGLAIEAGRDVAGVVVTMTDRITEWNGTVRDKTGSPSPDCTLVVYPDSESQWVPRRIKIARPASDGTFTIRGLPPGAYKVAAVTAIEPDQWLDAAFLKTLRPIQSLTLINDQVISRDIVRQK